MYQAVTVLSFLLPVGSVPNSEYSALWKALNPREGKHRYAVRKAAIRAWKAVIRPRKALRV